MKYINNIPLAPGFHNKLISEAIYIKRNVNFFERKSARYTIFYLGNAFLPGLPGHSLESIVQLSFLSLLTHA